MPLTTVLAVSVVCYMHLLLLKLCKVSNERDYTDYTEMTEITATVKNVNRPVIITLFTKKETNVEWW